MLWRVLVPAQLVLTATAGPAGFELGDAVEAFGTGIGHPGQDGGDDLAFPAGDGAGERRTRITGSALLLSRQQHAASRNKAITIC